MDLNQLTQAGTFCALPFVHQEKNMQGQHNICCYSNEKQFDTPDQNSFDSFNSGTMNSIRTQMLNGLKPKQCASCYQLEDQGIRSPRLSETNVWLNSTGYLESIKLKRNIQFFQQNRPITPISYDLRYSNTCTLKCRMCNSGSSSSINQEYSKLTAKWPDKFWTVDNPRINHAVEITEDITKVYLAGGEPLVEPLNLALLNQLADVNPEVNLVINTSLNHLSDRFLTILNRFQHLTLAVSLDGTAAVNDYIRSGSDFATVTENIKQVMHHYLMFGSCISIYNIFNVPDLVQFVIDNYPTAKDNHGINIVGGIDELALDNVPVKLRPMLIEQLTAALDIAGAQARPGIQNLIVTLEQDNFDQARFERFKRYTTILDQNRNQSVGAVVPELAEYF